MRMRPLLLLTLAGCIGPEDGCRFVAGAPNDGEIHRAQFSLGEEGVLSFAATQSYNCGLAGSCEMRPIAVGAREIVAIGGGYRTGSAAEVTSSDPSVLDVTLRPTGLLGSGPPTVDLVGVGPGRATMTVRVGELTDRLEVEVASIEQAAIAPIPDCVPVWSAAFLRVVAADDRERQLLGAGVGAWSTSDPDVTMIALTTRIPVEPSVDAAQRVYVSATQPTTATIEVRIGDVIDAQSVRFAEQCSN